MTHQPQPPDRTLPRSSWQSAKGHVVAGIDVPIEALGVGEFELRGPTPRGFPTPGGVGMAAFFGVRDVRGGRGGNLSRLGWGRLLPDVGFGTGPAVARGGIDFGVKAATDEAALAVRAAQGVARSESRPAWNSVLSSPVHAEVLRTLPCLATRAGLPIYIVNSRTSPGSRTPANARSRFLDSPLPAARAEWPDKDFGKGHASPPGENRPAARTVRVVGGAHT